MTTLDALGVVSDTHEVLRDTPCYSVVKITGLTVAFEVRVSERATAVEHAEALAWLPVGACLDGAFVPEVSLLSRGDVWDELFYRFLVG